MMTDIVWVNSTNSAAEYGTPSEIMYSLSLENRLATFIE